MSAQHDPAPSGRWSFWIDRGGTFTDVVARDPGGRLHVEKLLSADPEHYEDATLEALRRFLGEPPWGPERVEAIRMGTTVATNALLERHGAPVVLVTTAGCEDLLEIGTQARPELFALEIRKPTPLIREVIGLAEAVDPQGRVLEAPDLRALRARLEQALARGVRSLAVALKHAYANPAHERAVGALGRALGFEHVGLSHEVVGELGLTGRGDTTTADAYLTPLLRAYVERLRRRIDPAVRLRFMQSSGGLADASRFSGKDAIFSGPAGGVVAAAHVAERSGVAKAIGFDMGGTSTDVCRIDLAQGFERTYERVVAGVRIKAPMLDVITIAAGGGSLLTFDGRKLTVGPESAGADPGPVCYRRPGGRLAITDANLVLGRVQPTLFPTCFGPGADQPLDLEAARAAMARLADEVGRASGRPRTVEELAAGFVRIANDDMARAIREVSVARGYDVSEYALVCFGGAGGQHACALADMLGMRRVLLHPLGGVLSAYGMGLADVVHAGVEAVLAPLDAARAPLEAAWARLAAQGRQAVVAQGVAEGAIEQRPSAELRYVGVDAALDVPAPAAGAAWQQAWRRAFEERHQRLFGFTRPGHALELVNARLETIGRGAAAGAPAQGEAAPHPAEPTGRTVTVWFDLLAPDGHRRLEAREVPVYERDALTPGASLRGPALLHERVATIVVDPGWSARVDAAGALLLEREAAGAPLAADGELREAFAELARALLEGLEGVEPAALSEAVAQATEQGEAMGLDPEAAQAVALATARELGLSPPLATGVVAAPAAPRERVSTERDPVLLEIMGNLYMSIAEQMGATLRRVSLSVNIKERLDFSCAVFDAQGGLVANAPHIPVHLGAMSESVRAIHRARAASGDLRAGDVLLTNDPYQGGSHLPDITVITPVFAGEELVFWVANRGHHADVGGVVPGSMPPFSRAIEEEGVRLHDVLLVRDGALRAAELRALLAAGPHPVRGIDERLADLEAQVAANAQGVRLLGELVERYGLEAVSAYMRHVQDDAAAAMREAIAALPDGTHAWFDHLDDGARIAVAVTIAGEHATVDFTGTDPLLPGNLNAPRAVVMAAVLYVFRTLVQRPIPLNQGCFAPLEVIVPAGSLLDPRPPAAVVGGNVETSQRLVDVLYGALGRLAAAQGTMNNFTFGGADFGYYETICGGAGAGFGFDGASAVHTHMTNTRITDPEVLERRFPVRLRAFRVRRGSGGGGVWRGGDGVVREIELLAPIQAAILSERRAVAPFGLGGAGPGARGRNALVRRDSAGRVRAHELPGKVRIEGREGDLIVIETPGGGGYTPSPREWAAMDPALARRLFREGRWRGPTSGIAMDRVQDNQIALPSA